MRTLFSVFLAPLFFLALIPAGTAADKETEMAAPQADALRAAAISGDAGAQLKLATEFFFGTRTRPRNPVLAVYWFRRAADQGNAEATYNLGVCYEKGWGVEQPSLVRASRNYDAAAAKGLPEAKLRKALLLARGIPNEPQEKGMLPGTPADRPQALKLLRGLVQTNFLPADRELGRMILTDSVLRRKNGAEAKKLLTRAAEAGDMESLLMLAQCYEDGIGGMSDDAKAAECYRKAAERGSAEAKVLLGADYEFGRGVKPDPKRAYDLVCEAAKAGNPRALTRLGDYYLNGDIVKPSVFEARKLYERAYKAGYIPAAVKLGRCAELGLCGKPEPERAAELYAIAARAGDPDGQFAFGRCHLKGIGMEKDATGAVFWFKTATAGGQIEAVRELGICYLTGTGVKKDEAEGARLLDAAAASGDTQAILLLNRN